MSINLNFTNRVDLLPNEVQATYRIKDGLGIELNLVWELSARGFNQDSTVCIDLTTNGTSQAIRLDLGKLGDKNEWTETVLGIRDPELMKLRFKVVDKGPDGVSRIRGNLDNIRPIDAADTSESRSLLTIIKDDDLGSPWALGFETGEPVLRITGRSDLYGQLRNASAIFFPLVLPEVVRQIFLWVVRDASSEEDELIEKWKTFFTNLGCKDSIFAEVITINNDEQAREIDQLATMMMEEFSKNAGLVSKIALLLQSEDSQ